VHIQLRLYIPFSAPVTLTLTLNR